MQNRRILVIKIGAAGDVIRTSTLLHLYNNDEIVWITATTNITLLPIQNDNLEVIAIEDVAEPKSLGHFSLVISLDEDIRCAEIATQVNSDLLVGIYLDNDKVTYTDDSAKWFGMGLASKLGKEKADQIKMVNKLSYQEILFEMLGHSFKGEEYLINKSVQPQPKQKLIGIEARAGKRWPTKVWHKYPELAEKLRAEGYQVIFFEQQEDILDYIKDIAQCEMVITGDSLAMHIALALKINTLALFTCTSAAEIYGYNRLTKIASPLLFDAFYTNDYRLDVLEGIKVEQIMNIVTS